ncbi:uncharacterized protein cp110 [Larimichthys crocea]|uniref:uncharacterized protein cp110 n=1 Tax=Larimichthys crocea TaxID=215358 RepID=UPI000F5FE078|nr:uncharacterized protein LOC104930257 [Larimichthys crocea]
MEDYDKFVQHRLCHLRESEHNNKPSLASSLIRFHGRPILPPLLSGEQREEMQRHREAAQKAADHRKLKDDARMAYVQTILHSVQLRKTPTLEELLQESEINTKSSYSHGSVSQGNHFIGTKDTLLLSPPPGSKEKDGVSLPPLTSTTYSAFFASNVTPQQSYQEGCLIDQHYSQQGSQSSSLNGASHQSVSSGYVTYENVENTASVSGGIDEGKASHGFDSTGGAYDMGGFFLHNTSNTIAKMPDIISHPPIDGEELERSGLESSFCNDFIVVKDICCSSLQDDSDICDHLPGDKSQSSHVDSTGGEDNIPITVVVDHNLDRTEGLVSSPKNCVFSDNPELSQTLSTNHPPTAEPHIQHNPTETEPTDNHVDESEPYDEPYRLSLQALLKKSQEYRRRQRMLRNQAKNTKVQERTQEQPRVRAEEQSLSDKENDEFPQKGPAEGKNTKERKGTFIPSAETSPKEAWENERIIESEFLGKKANLKSESTHLTGGNTQEMNSVEEETTFKNNKLNVSQEVVTEPKHISTFPQQQPMSTETSPVHEAFYLNTSPTASHKGVGRYHTIPAPNYCRSPVHCKSKGSVQDGEAADGAETSKRKVLVNTDLNKNNKLEEVHLEHQNGHRAVPPTVNFMVEGDVTSFTAKSSQHIDQLVSSLSGLKVLISDLESTLTENLGNHSQTGSNTRSEFSFESVKHSEIKKKHEQHMQPHQSDCDGWEDRLRDGDAEQDQRYRERPGRQSSDSFRNMHEDTGAELSISDTSDVPVNEVVNLSELRLVKTLAMERAKDKGTCKEGVTKSYGQHGGGRKQQPPAKCILSAAQRQRIPDIFRNVPSETMALRNVSVLSDTSNRTVERRNETAVEGHDSTHLPSLNQSYDVDAPSGLWFLDGSGSDLGSKGHLVHEMHLTPESGSEGQGSVSKVKRRLVMHVTEETRERSTDASRGGTGPAVRPSSSTPKAAVRQYEGHGSQKDKQEQLKQAHAAQVRALQEEHRRQQEELLQALAVRYHLLQSVSFPCSMSSSRLGDTLTFSTLSQPSKPLLEHYRPLLSAAVKGFLTRRLLKTERVAQLVRTIRDTQQFLQALQQQQSPGRGEFSSSRQDILLQERVSLQLRAARYEVNDIFFILSTGERMQLISWDRELARERELRRQSGHTGRPREKSSLSAATQKSLERKRGMMIQKKAAGKHRGAVTRTGHNTGLSAEQPSERKRGQFRANPQRVPRSTYSSRPR